MGSKLSNFNVDDCSVLLALKIISKKWVAFILSELLVIQRVSFVDFLNHVKSKYGKKISGRVLTDALNLLEKNDIIIREVLEEKPLRVNYYLTEKGEDLQIVFGALKAWGLKWGGIKQKKCIAFTCIHNAVPALDIEKAKKMLVSQPK